MSSKFYFNILTTFLVLLVIIPILVLIFSILNFDVELWKELSEYIIYDVSINTILLLILVIVGVIFLGVSLAWLVTMVKFPGAKYFEWLLLLPFAIPAYVFAFIFLGLFDYSGYIQGFLYDYFSVGRFDIRNNVFIVALVFILSFYPYVYLLVKNNFKYQKHNIIVARTLKSSVWKIFFKIAIPQARPAIFGGTLLVIMETLSDFGVVTLLSYDTFTTAIYSAWSDYRSLEGAMQLSMILILVTITITYIEKRTRSNKRFFTKINNYHKHPIYKPTPLKQGLIFLGLTLFLTIVLILPLTQLIYWILDNNNIDFYEQFILIANSLFVIILSVLIMLFLAFFIIVPFHINSKGKHNRIISYIINLGYSLPGVMIAISILYSIHLVSNFINIGSFLFGSIGILIYAYVIRFISISYNYLEAGVSNVSVSVINSAICLGVSKYKIMYRIYFPLLKPSLLISSLIISIDVIKELPATYLLKPVNWDMFSVKVYEYSTENMFAQASVSALTMILVISIIMYVVYLIENKYLINKSSL